MVIRLAAALGLLACVSVALAEGAFAPTRVDEGPGSATAIAHWQIQSSFKAQQGGAEVSSDGFSTEGWFPAGGRATVMAGLMENGKYENVFYGDNLRAVEEPDASGTMFVTPWWYRSPRVNATRVTTSTPTWLTATYPSTHPDRRAA